MKQIFLLSCLLMGSVMLVQAQQAPAKDTAALKQYVGKYVFPAGSVVDDVTVAIEDSGLTMASSAGTSVLEKQGDDLYTIVQFQGTARFNRNEAKKIMGVSINAMGYQLEGTKVEDTRTLAVLRCKQQARTAFVAAFSR